MSLQMGKLSCIPYMVFYQSTFLGMSFSGQTKSALAVVVVGMAIAVVTDVQLNALGCVYSIASVLATSHFQTVSARPAPRPCLPAPRPYLF